MVGLSNRIGANPFPGTFYTRLTYTSRFALTPTVADTLTTHLFACNGLYDVNITGTGHQPLGFDQFMSIYNHYEVLGSKCVVDFNVKGTSTATAAVVVGVHVNDDNIIHSNNLNQMIENGKVRYKTLSLEKNTARLVCKWSQKKTFGTTARGNNEMRGTGSSNPSEMSKFAIFTQAMDHLSIGDTVACMVRLTFFVKFSERGDLSQS